MVKRKKIERRGHLTFDDGPAFSAFSLFCCRHSMFSSFFLVVVAESGEGIQPQ